MRSAAKRVASLLVLAAILDVQVSAQSSAAVPTAANYDPSKVDWASVVAACRQAGAWEKRFRNFWIRAAFHDGLAIDPTECSTTGTISGCFQQNGLDASLFLSNESTRPPNVYDNFTAISAVLTIRIATVYNTSVADALAVCSTVAVEDAAKVDVLSNKKLLVGRVDSTVPGANVLPLSVIGTQEFATFFTQRGFNIEEGVALLGSHSLIDEQGCYQGGRKFCDPNADPSTATCQDVRMFQLENHYYHELCTPSIAVKPFEPLLEDFPDTVVPDMNDAEFESIERSEQCKWTSKEMRAFTVNVLERQRSRDIPFERDAVLPVEAVWDSYECNKAPAGVDTSISCPRFMPAFPYTVNDAYLGLACQGTIENPDNTTNTAIRNAMRKMLDNNVFKASFVSAFLKMVNPPVKTGVIGTQSLVSDQYEQFTSPIATSKVKCMYIDGKECPGGIDPATGVCSTIQLNKAFPASFLIELNPSPATVPQAPVQPSPANRAASKVFGALHTAILIRRLDNAVPLILSEVAIHTEGDVLVKIDPSWVSSSTGAAAGALVDGDIGTYVSTDPNSWDHWFLIRLPAGGVNVTRVTITKKPASAFAGAVVDVVNKRGTVTQLVTAVTGDVFKVDVTMSGLVAQGELPTLAPGNVNFIITRFDGGPLSVSSVDLFSRRFKLISTVTPCGVAPATTRKLCSHAVAAANAAASCLHVTAKLSPLTRVDRIVLRGVGAGVQGAYIYFGQPEIALASTVPTNLPAGDITLFARDALAAAAGDVQDITAFGARTVVIRRLAKDGALGFGPQQVKLYNTDKQQFDFATAVTAQPDWIKIDLTKLPGVNLGWVVLPAGTAPAVATTVEITTTDGAFSAVWTDNSAGFTTALTADGVVSYAGAQLISPAVDDKIYFIVARYDGKPLTVAEIRLYGEEGNQITDGLEVISAGSSVTQGVKENILDSTDNAATVSGSPAWFAVSAPANTDISKVAVVGGLSDSGSSLAGAYVYLRDPEAIVGGTLVLPAEPTGLPTVYDAVVGVSTLIAAKNTDLTASKTGAAAINPNLPGNMSDPPVSPYIDSKFCVNMANQYEVRGFPSSFTQWKPFTRQFVNPPTIEPIKRSCRPDGHCMTHYNLDVVEFTVDVGCGKPTTVVGYGGVVPGPTFIVPQGEETSVRFNNLLIGGKYGETEHPCNETGRTGRPISIHHHGSASTAPHDGWAENLLCGGESKDYFYPSNRPGTGWYHDHALDLTAENAYRGLAGFYIVTNAKGQNNNCGQPWNLDNIPEYSLVLADKVLDQQCELVFDHRGVHKDNLYGDLNLVSGIPWPVLTVQPQTVRFRFLIGGPTRPFKLSLVTAKGDNVGSAKAPGSTRTRCQVIAGDGGYRQSPADLPADGMFMAVAERWEWVCDLSDLASTTLYIWNSPDEKRGKHVPFFCLSHLVMKINVLPGCAGNCPAATTRVFEEAGPNYRCGGKCYQDQGCKLNDQQYACCAAGQYCFRNDQWNWYCRSTPTPAPTCNSYKPTKPDGNGNLKCGGRCYLPDCSAEPKQHACCPAGQFCWHNDEWNHYCRANPPQGPSGAAPALNTCNAPKFVFDKPFRTVLDRVLSQRDIDAAMTMINNGKFHREMKFGRRQGAWVINGENWFTFKIAARDVGQNTWEVWKLETGGGWFHPIHIHLVDFWVMKRDGPIKKVEDYEKFTPKDVVALHPSATIYILARWGPHRGDYMFHCHNLVHEDRAMMRAFRVTNYQGSQNAPSVNSGGVDFTLLHGPTDIVYDLYNYKDPLTEYPSKNPVPLTNENLQKFVDRNVYRIFYPLEGTDNAVLSDTTKNPWRVLVYRTRDTCPVGMNATEAFYESNFRISRFGNDVRAEEELVAPPA